jgi:hypothetical protein
MQTKCMPSCASAVLMSSPVLVVSPEGAALETPDKSRRVQVYESEHAVSYDFTKNVRMA